MGHACGEPNEIEWTAAHRSLYRPPFLFRPHHVQILLDHHADLDEKVRALSRSIPPPWGSIRFRLAPRTYDAPPMGAYVWYLTA